MHFFNLVSFFAFIVILFSIPISVSAHPFIERFDIITKYPNGTHIHHDQIKEKVDDLPKEDECTIQNCFIEILIAVIISIMSIVTIFVHREDIFKRKFN